MDSLNIYLIFFFKELPVHVDFRIKLVVDFTVIRVLMSYFGSVLNKAGFILFNLFYFYSSLLYAQTAREVAVEIKASWVSGLGIKLDWRYDANTTSYDVYKRSGNSWVKKKNTSGLTWIDVTVNNTTAIRSENRNVPGDGKFDRSYINPSGTATADIRYVQLPIGRIDLSNMPHFGRDTA